MKNQIIEILNRHSKDDTSDATGHSRTWIDESEFNDVAEDIMVVVLSEIFSQWYPQFSNDKDVQSLHNKIVENTK